MPLYLTLLHTALATELRTVVPIIMVLLVVGVGTATVQAAFQLEDTALSLMPRVIVMIVIALFGAFDALDVLKSLAVTWIGHAAMLVHEPWS